MRQGQLGLPSGVLRSLKAGLHFAAVQTKPAVFRWGTGCEDGANQCAARLPECREAWKATGLDQAKLQGHHQVPAGDAEARLHW